MPSVVVKNISKCFGTVKALDNVSFTVADKSFLTLLGPSGCGKTTMLRLIAGFERPDEGEIHIGSGMVSSGEQNLNMPASERNLGMVFQSYALWPHMTVFENIAYPLRLRKMRGADIQQKVKRVLNLIQLEEIEKRYPSELSGGQQQRVALARSLVYEPAVLLLDEPLSNLDAKLRKEMRLELRELQQRTQITAVYVTHDQAEALVISDQICIMNAGRIQQIGTPSDIYKNSNNLFVADFIGGSNFVNGRIINRTLSHEKYLPVRLFNGQTVYCFAKKLPDTDDVAVCIRPEFIDVKDKKPQDTDEYQNVFAVKVLQKAYLGSEEEFKVDLNGQIIHVACKPKEMIRPGDQVWIIFDSDDCIPLTK
jgi:iron(III) transport system ATP-binding protein